ncbi:MAG: hypothetical protein GOV15_00590, partial [Candidatus Diapherotrites archaeon]|nr:hypothetical protein [Candidatus Diapherotrites archaeon]
MPARYEEYSAKIRERLKKHGFFKGLTVPKRTGKGNRPIRATSDPLMHLYQRPSHRNSFSLSRRDAEEFAKSELSVYNPLANNGDGRVLDGNIKSVFHNALKTHGAAIETHAPIVAKIRDIFLKKEEHEASKSFLKRRKLAGEVLKLRVELKTAKEDAGLGSVSNSAIEKEFYSSLWKFDNLERHFRIHSASQITPSDHQPVALGEFRRLDRDARRASGS